MVQRLLLKSTWDKSLSPTGLPGKGIPTIGDQQ